MSAAVVVERAGRIATVRLDGPERHNVLDRDGWDALAGAFAALAGDEEVGCVVVRGSGGRAFSAGSDIGAFAAQRDTPADVRAYAAAIAGALGAIRECPHPVIAAVEGLCVGGGLEIAAACDVRLCGASSRFGAPIHRLGLTMSHAELAPLVELLGPAPVLELLLTGELVDAERALALGLVGRVVPDDRVLEEAHAVAESVAAGAPLVNRWHKRFVRRVAEGGTVSDEEQAEALEAFATDDYREGRAAFLEKRRPRFRGR